MSLDQAFLRADFTRLPNENSKSSIEIGGQYRLYTHVKGKPDTPYPQKDELTVENAGDTVYSFSGIAQLLAYADDLKRDWSVRDGVAGLWFTSKDFLALPTVIAVRSAAKKALYTLPELSDNAQPRSMAPRYALHFLDTKFTHKLAPYPKTAADITPENVGNMSESFSALCDVIMYATKLRHDNYCVLDNLANMWFTAAEFQALPVVRSAVTAARKEYEN